MDDIKYPLARTHQFIHHAPQFRPVKRGPRRKGLLRKYESKDHTKSLEIAIFAELDIADQDLLLCLLAMLLPEDKGQIIDNVPVSADNARLREELILTGDLEKRTTLGATTTAYEILTELKKGVGHKQYEWLESSLKRLSRVNFTYRELNRVSSFNLLSWTALLNRKTGKMTSIKYVINPLSAQAVLSNKGGYYLCHRGERAKLKSEEARALHSVLSGLVMRGNKRSLSVDMLSDKVYSRYDEDVSDNAIRIRRRAIVNALEQINTLAYWSCTVSGRGKDVSALIQRKKLSV